MTGPPQDVVQAATALPSVSAVQWVASTTSTNAVLLARLQADPAIGGTVLLADRQTAGRGRRGRTWTAPPGTSLMLSMAVRSAVPAASWSLLPLAAGSAVVEACRAVLPDVDPGRLTLKWPNDLLVGGVKAAGILVEAAGAAVVVGIGINVDWRGVDRPSGLVATSLAEAAGRPVDRWAVLEALLAALDGALALAQTDPAGVVRRYVPDCATLGCAVVAHGAPPVRGTAVGLTVDGHLRIRRADGREQAVAAGDVEHLR